MNSRFHVRLTIANHLRHSTTNRSTLEFFMYSTQVTRYTFRVKIFTEEFSQRNSVKNMIVDIDSDPRNKWLSLSSFSS